MKKEDYLQACDHVFNIPPLKKVLKLMFKSKKDQEEIQNSNQETIYDFIKSKLSVNDINSLIISNFQYFTQDIYVYHLDNFKKQFDMNALDKSISSKPFQTKFEGIDNIVNATYFSATHKVYFYYKTEFRGYKIDPSTGGVTGKETTFTYYVPAMIEFLSPYYLKIRVCKYSIRSGIREHFNGEKQFLLSTQFGSTEVVDDVLNFLSKKPIGFGFDITDFLPSVKESAQTKKISTNILKWDEKDNIHYTHRGRNNKTLHPYHYVQKVLNQDAQDVGDGKWYLTDPKVAAQNQPMNKLSSFKVIPRSGYISFDRYLKDDIEDKVNEFIKLAK